MRSSRRKAAHRRPELHNTVSGTCRVCDKPVTPGSSGRSRSWHTGKDGEPNCLKDWEFISRPSETRKTLMLERRPICEAPGCGEITIELHVDHVVPLIDWTGDPRAAFDRSNLQLLCVPCHKRKTSAEATARAATRRARC